MTDKIFFALEQFYHGDIPGYIKDAGETYITVQISDWDDSRVLKITLSNVIDYYATDARNILSGIRTIAGYSGDWKPIDQLAQAALEWFKYVNRLVLAREGERRGMTLRT